MSDTTTTPSVTPAQFEQSMQSLQRLVTELEQGELPLDQALERFSQGLTLIRDCQQALQQAEQIVTQLSHQLPTDDHHNED